MVMHARAILLAGLGALWTAAASAQVPDTPYIGGDGRLAIAGEVAVALSPPDSAAYFNYTDYDHNALRNVRGRLLAQWHIASRVALLGELRLENADSLAAAALYLRWRPWQQHDFDIQVGRIPPVVGAFARHAYGRDNVVIGTPLAYQYLTSLRPDALPATADDLLRMRARGWRPSFPIGSQAISGGLPLVTAFHWDTGIESHWHRGYVDLAGALTRGAPATPVFRGTHDEPAVSGRAAVNVGGLTVGVSAARGHWISRSVLEQLPDAVRDQTSQSLVGADAEYGLGRLLLRGEWLRSAFDLPHLSSPQPATPLVASSGFIEGRYRWRPRWQAAARVERLSFSSIRGALLNGDATPWEAPVRRFEVVIGYRAARNLEVRTGWQHNWRDGGRIPDRGYPALQVLYWF